MDWLPTYAHNSEVITALPLIPTLYKWLLQTLSLLQPAVYSTAVSWQRMLTVEILNLPRVQVLPVRRISRNWTLSISNSTITPSLLSLPCRAQLNCHPSTNSLNSSHCHLKRLSQFSSAKLVSSLYSSRADPTENTVPNSSSIVAIGGCRGIARISLTCLLVVTKQQPLSHCLFHRNRYTRYNINQCRTL
jgi:hypothetical protein